MEAAQGSVHMHLQYSHLARASFSSTGRATMTDDMPASHALLEACPSVCPSVHLSACLSVPLSVRRSVHAYVCQTLV